MQKWRELASIKIGVDSHVALVAAQYKTILLDLEEMHVPIDIDGLPTIMFQEAVQQGTALRAEFDRRMDVELALNRNQPPSFENTWRTLFAAACHLRSSLQHTHRPPTHHWEIPATNRTNDVSETTRPRFQQQEDPGRQMMMSKHPNMGTTVAHGGVLYQAFYPVVVPIGVVDASQQAPGHGDVAGLNTHVVEADAVPAHEDQPARALYQAIYPVLVLTDVSAYPPHDDEQLGRVNGYPNSTPPGAAAQPQGMSSFSPPIS